MLTEPVWLITAYLVLGLLTCLFARRGWPEDWDETLLASILGPPVFLMLAVAAAAGALLRRDRPGDLVSHAHGKRLAHHSLSGASHRLRFETDPGRPGSQRGR
jgi:hypothetical protein